MSKLEIAVLLDAAIEHTLALQSKLLTRKDASAWLPIAQRLNTFAVELQQWRSGKFYLKDLSHRFLTEARAIEQEADDLSEKLWTPFQITLVAVCTEIARVTAQSRADKTFTKRLKDHYNNTRLALLEQVAGARLLENNADLGDEVERILVQYLSRALGPTVRVLRGGHIYDHADNRSDHQIDIIVTPSDALGYCPADTEDGKFNVMIDQVLATLSVKSTLTPAKLEDCWNEIQGIPLYVEKDKAHPHLHEAAWPMCFIVGAYAESLKGLEQKWHELRDRPMRHVPQMVVVLDTGYMISDAGTWPLGQHQAAAPGVRCIEGLAAGLGLGWLTTAIAGHHARIQRKSLNWITELARKLHRNEATPSVPATYEPRYHYFGQTHRPIHGVFRWGPRSMWAHNRLYLWTVMAGDQELCDPTRAVKQTGWQQSPFAYRMFRVDAFATHGRLCALEEWIDPQDKELHRRQIAVFDSETGKELIGPQIATISSIMDVKTLAE